MALRVILNNNQLGSFLCTPDPDGLNEFEIELKRSTDNDGVFYEFAIGLRFVKGAREYIRDVYELEGIEGVITTFIEEYDPNNYKWNQIYEGQLRLKDYRIDELFVESNIEKTGYERSFLNNKNIEVSLDNDSTIKGEPLQPLDSIDLPIPGKTILKKADLQPSTVEAFNQDGFIIFDFAFGDRVENKSATRFINLNLANFIVDDFNIRNVNYNISEIAPLPIIEIDNTNEGQYTIDLNTNHDIEVSVINTGADVDVRFEGSQRNTALAQYTVTGKVQLRDINDNILEDITFGSISSNVGNNTEKVQIGLSGREFRDELSLNLSDGQFLYVFYEFEISGFYQISLGAAALSHNISINAIINTGGYEPFKFLIDAKTIFQTTNVKSYLIFEVFDYVIRYLTDNQATLKSNILGRTDLGYQIDGKASLTAITNGWFLRNINNDRSLFANMETLLGTFSSIYCLGWTFETEGNNNFIRIESKDYFYNKNNKIITYNNLSELSKSAKTDLYYKKISAEFPKLEDIAITSSIDEWNTKRTYNTPITQTDNELKLQSGFRASSYEIESQRRLTNLDISSQLDDENFLIGLIRDESDYRVKVGSDYNFSIENIVDSDTAFNIDYRPTEWIKNWRKVLASTVFRGLNKTIKFASGTGNYNLIVNNKTEKRNFIINNNEALWINDQIEFTIPFNSENREIITNNLFGYIEVIDYKGNKMYGYVLNVVHVVEENKAEVTLLKANL